MTHVSLKWLITSLLFLFFVPALAQTPPVEAPPPGKAVLITGASSGIGLKMTEHLSSRGYLVYAGARKKEDLAALGKLPNVHPIKLDVTQQADIDAAVKAIRSQGRGLYALVNNAGVGSYGPLLETSEEEFHFVMNVNVYGPYRVTRAFAPLLQESRGKIVITGSLFGVSSMPYMGAYAMSKHAMEAFADTLAQELAPSGVSVSIIEPGTYRTSIYKNTHERLLRDQTTITRDLPQWQKEFLESDKDPQEKYPPPDAVAQTLYAILSSDSPKRRYMIVPEEQQAKSTLKHALRRAVELNENSSYPYEEEKMHRLLDEVMNRKKR